MSFTTKLPPLWISILANVVLSCMILWHGMRSQLFDLTKNVIKDAEFALDPETVFQRYPVDFDNATAVFNTVHGALKERNSNLHPVGVSFIPAYLPPNTLMYHSTRRGEIPSLFEWIAMDYEFSYSFAQFQRGKERHRGPPPQEGRVPIAAENAPPGQRHPPFRSSQSYFFTFRNTKALDKLIYLDGASAAKTNTGEMDQQLILSRQSNADDRVDEREAAEVICKWGKEFGLQGIVRLEIGFEIILCDFFDHIELVSNVTMNNVTELGGLPFEPPVPKTELERKRSALVDQWQAVDGFEWLKAGANVDNGDSRILLDFSKMVTPLNKTWIDPDSYKRRINHIPEKLKDGIIKGLRLNLKEPVNPYHKTDWQQITERMVEKFGPILVNLNSSLNFFEFEKTQVELEVALEHAVTNITKTTFNFIRRYSDQSITNMTAKMEHSFKLAVQDFVFHTYPLTTPLEALIFVSIHKVGREVLETVFDLYNTARLIIPDLYVEPSSDNYSKFEEILLEKRDRLGFLLKKLAWSIFYHCSEACRGDEICYTPTWGPGPLGWGPSSQKSKFFEFDGDRYRIPHNLHCVSYRDLLNS